MPRKKYKSKKYTLEFKHIMRKQKLTAIKLVTGLFNRILVIVGAAGLMVAFFLVLPLMQALATPPDKDLLVGSIDSAKLEAPEAPPEIEEEEPEQEEEKPPELAEEAPPLDLSQLELALNPVAGGGMMSGDFAVNLNTFSSGDQGSDTLFSIAELDQKPRVVYSPSPTITNEMRKKSPGKVYVIFIVNENGRVENPKIQSSSDTAFEAEALKAIKKWKFEPGKRGGKAVRSRMRLPFVF